MKIELVKFSNGQYGIRKYVFLMGYQYKDLRESAESNWWWGKDNSYFRDCQSTRDKAVKAYKDMGKDEVKGRKYI